MAERAPRRRTWIEAIEAAPAGGWAWALLLLGWILLRNLLEGVLERPHQLGFDWRGDVSFGMVFLHFPLFYLTLFLGIALLLHLLTRRPLGAVARAVALGFAILLVAPLVDAAVSRGRGYDLKYLLGLGGVIWRFWDPSASVSEVSPGQRVEIVLAVLLGAAYAWTGSDGRRAARALAAALGIYLLAALLGAWPAHFARLGGQTGAEAYQSAYRMQGLVADESRRLALVTALPFLAGLLAFAGRLSPERFGLVLRRLSWTRVLHYTGLVPAGAYLGWLTYRDHLVAFRNPVDAAAAVALWAAMAAAFLAALVWNDTHDREADRVSDPGRRRPIDALPPDAARALGVAFPMLALFLALCVGYAPFLLMTAILLLAWLYSAPPVRLKRVPGAATATLAVLSLLSLGSGFSLFAQEMTLAAIPARLAAWMLIGITLGFTAKDLKDAEGDRAQGVVTLATRLPPRRARALTAVLVATGYLLGPVFLPLGAGFAALAIAFALASAWVTLRRRRPDDVLLLGFVAFAVLCLALLTLRPQTLREGGPAPLGETHARLRAAEEETRIVRVLEADPGGAGDLRARAERAVRALSEVLAIVPAARAAEAWDERARWARSQIADGARAGADLAGLTARRPLRVAYLDARVAAASRGGRIDAAIAACGEAIDRGVRPGDFHRNRAALVLGTGAAGPAVERDLAAASGFGQRRPMVLVLLGDLLLRRGETGAAGEAYARAADRDPDLPEAWGGLGEARHAQGDLEGALRSYARARALAPRDPWVLNNEGVVLRDAGRREEALERFREAHALAPELFEPAFNAGLALERLGRAAEAHGWFRRARQARPGFPPVEEALRRTTPVAGEGSDD